MLTDEMKKAIENSLPAQMSGVLKARLEAFDDLEKELIAVKDQRDCANSEQAKERKRCRDYAVKVQNLEAEKKDNESRVKLSTLRHKEFDVTIAELKQANAEHELATVLQLVDKVFGHPAVTVSSDKQIFHSTEQTYDSNNNLITKLVPNGGSETTTTTESKI